MCLPRNVYPVTKCTGKCIGERCTGGATIPSAAYSFRLAAGISIFYSVFLVSDSVSLFSFRSLDDQLGIQFVSTSREAQHVISVADVPPQ